MSKFLLEIIPTLHRETGDVQKQGRVLVSAAAILCISHQLNMLNLFPTKDDCVLFVKIVEILKLAAFREADGSGGSCSAYNKLILCSLGYTHTHTHTHTLLLFCSEFTKHISLEVQYRYKFITALVVLVQSLICTGIFLKS